MPPCRRDAGGPSPSATVFVIEGAPIGARQLLHKHPERYQAVGVLALFDVDEHYGLIALVKRGRRRYHFPLCDLKAADTSSPNHDRVMEYAVWFANR